jgi:formate hydrogenlyase subunit 4
VSLVSAALAIMELLAALALAPLMLSVIARTKARFAGRVGPPWAQPYRDLAKLMRKGGAYSRTTTWVFRAGPIVGLAALLTAATLVPILSDAAPLGFWGDLVLVAYLLALGRMFTVIAALDTGSSFEGMGASREVTFGTLSEPALFLALAALAIAARSLQLSEVLGRGTAERGSVGPALPLIVVALAVVMLCECSRVPVDDPATHLELTMVHEVMVLDHGGPDLAFITYGAALKLMLLGSLVVHAAIPHDGLPSWIGAPLRLVELGALAVVVGVVESVMARLRMTRVPLLLAVSSVVAGLAVLLSLAGRAS